MKYQPGMETRCITEALKLSLASQNEERQPFINQDFLYYE